MRRDELPLVVLDGRHAGQLLAHPCGCPDNGCASLGEHLWDSTANMAPGPQAQAFEPRAVTPSSGTGDGDPRPDPTGRAHQDYRALLARYRAAALDLAVFVARHRPDRAAPVPEPASDQDWCANHLEVLGVCEPRHVGDLCRWCWEVQRSHGTAPDRQWMRERHDRGRSTPAMEAGFLARVRAARKRRRQ